MARPTTASTFPSSCSISRSVSCSRHVRFHGPVMFAFTFSTCSLPRACHVRFHGPAMFVFTFPPCSLPRPRRVRFHGPATFAFTFPLCSLLFSVMFASTFSPCWLPQAMHVPLSCSRHVLSHVRFHDPSVFAFMFLLCSFPRSLPGSLSKFTGAIKQQIGVGPPNTVQALCESRGGRPELSVLMSLTVSVDVKQH